MAEPLDLAALAQALTEVWSWPEQPTYMVNPYGAFVRDPDGKVTVYDYDTKGNHYELPEDEQQRRIDLWLKSME